LELPENMVGRSEANNRAVGILIDLGTRTGGE